MSADSSIVCFFVCFIVFGCELICGRIIFCNSAGINEGYVLSEIIWLEFSSRSRCHWGCYQSMTGLAHFNVLNYYRSCRFNSPTLKCSQGQIFRFLHRSQYYPQGNSSFLLACYPKSSFSSLLELCSSIFVCTGFLCFLTSQE